MRKYEMLLIFILGMAAGIVAGHFEGQASILRKFVGMPTIQLED